MTFDEDADTQEDQQETARRDKKEHVENTEKSNGVETQESKKDR